MEEAYYGRIEDYLDGTLTAAERTVFEADVLANPELAAALEDLRSVREKLAWQFRQEEDTKELRETLSHLGKQHFNKTESTKPALFRSIYTRWALAAAALIALLVGWSVWPAESGSLYEEYRKFPEAGFTTKGSSGADLAEADHSFNTGKYENALSILTVYLANNPTDTEARFFAGLCQLELNQFAAAEASFGQILSAPNVWSAEARWYLALIYLKQKRAEDCRNILKQIGPEEAHFADAQALLKNL